MSLKYGAISTIIAKIISYVARAKKLFFLLIKGIGDSYGTTLNIPVQLLFKLLFDLTSTL